MTRDPSEPIAEELRVKRRRPPPDLKRQSDKLADYKERTDDEFVPEPPTY